jgi:hypothetical protein
VVDSRVPVTEAQVDAAKLLVQRNRARDRPTSEAIRTIAQARVAAAHVTAIASLTSEAMNQIVTITELTESLIRENPALETGLRAIQEQSIRSIQELVASLGTNSRL